MATRIIFSAILNLGDVEAAAAVYNAQYFARFFFYNNKKTRFVQSDPLLTGKIQEGNEGMSR